MDNDPVSIFLTDARNNPLPIKMLHCLEKLPDPAHAAISPGLILMSAVVLAFGARTVGLDRRVQG